MRLRSSEKFQVILITIGLGRLRPIEEFKGKLKHERAERFHVIICISIELEKLYELRLWVSNGTLICGFDRALNRWGSKISVRLTIIENVEVLVDHHYHLVLPIRCTLLDLHISKLKLKTDSTRRSFAHIPFVDVFLVILDSMAELPPVLFLLHLLLPSRKPMFHVRGDDPTRAI